MLTGLKQRGARWYLRRRVPADLVEAWGSKEVNRALGTSDYKVARAMLPKAWADVDDEFAAKRALLPAQFGQGAPDPHVLAAQLLPKLRARRDAAAAAGDLPAFNQKMEDGLFYEQAVLDGQEVSPEALARHEGVRNALKALLTGDGALSIPVEAALAVMSAEDNPTVTELHALWLKQDVGVRPIRADRFGQGRAPGGLKLRPMYLPRARMDKA